MVKLDFHGLEERRWTGPRLRNSAIVGHTTTTATKLWVRCRFSGTYRLLLCSQPLSEGERDIGDTPTETFLAGIGEKLVASQTHDFADRNDRTHVFNFSRLTPNTRYYYYVVAEASEAAAGSDRFVLGSQVVHSFKTLAADKSTLVFGLYSCNDPFKDGAGTLPWKHFFSALEEQTADFVVGCGDQVYVDKTQTDIWKWLKKIKSHLLREPRSSMRTIMQSWYQDVYRGYWGFLDIRRVHRSFPNYMVWDDHEIMDGWGSRTRDELSDELDTWYEWEDQPSNLMLADAMFEAAKKVYGQYQHSHNPNTQRGVFDFALKQKHAEFFFLDMRGQREFDLARLRERDGARASDRILGKRQHARFRRWLREISTDTAMIYIVSPVPVVHWTGLAVNAGDILGAKDDFRDEWDHETNHRERDKFLDAVFAISDSMNIPVAFLSGDVHMSAVFRLSNNRFRRARVFQITSSPITRPPAPGIAELILSDKGTLKSLGKPTGYRFQRLAKFHTRNFCVLKSDIGASGDLRLSVDFYGESDDRDEVRRKRLHLLSPAA